MFNMGWPEILVVGAAALLLFGARRLPEAAKSLGRSLNAFKAGLKEGEAALKEGLEEKPSEPDAANRPG